MTNFMRATINDCLTIWGDVGLDCAFIGFLKKKGGLGTLDDYEIGSGDLLGIESRTKLLCVGEDGMNDKSCCSLFLANLDE